MCPHERIKAAWRRPPRRPPRRELRELEGVAGGNLRATPAERQLFERVLERQPHLGGIPPLGQLLGHTAAAVDFNPEAVEAERARAIRTVGASPLRPEPVARFL